MERNPWKIATIAIMASLFGAVVSGIVVAKSNDARNQLAAIEEVETPEIAPAPQSVAVPEVTATPPVPVHGME